MMKSTFIKICPKCGSTEIGVDASFHVADYCRSCGLGNMRASAVKEWTSIGPFPEIELRQIEAFRKRLQKKGIKGKEK